MTKLLRHAALFITLLLTALTGIGQTVTDPSNTPGYDASKLRAARASSPLLVKTKPGNLAQRTNPAVLSGTVSGSSSSMASAGCLIPLDDTYTAVPRNDDGSYGPIALPFTFNLYGTPYSQVWINTNGNLTFTGPYYSYTASGFPFDVPMVAPLWGDVDTRSSDSGAIYFKLSPTNLIVTWDHVGYYSFGADKLDTFQAIIGSSTDALLGPGQNVSLRYGDMQWASAYGSDSPSTAGINQGNGTDYVQIGLFGFENAAYDGPGGATDGVYYLNNQCFGFYVSNTGNIPPSASNLPANNTVTVACGQTVTINPQFLAPEVNQTVAVAVNTGGLCNTTVNTTSGATAGASIAITGAACNTGTHTLVLTATDNGTPVETTTVTITVVVTSCCNVQLAAASTPVTCPGGSDGALDLTVSNAVAPISYVWSNGSSSEDLANVPAGTYSVTVTDANGCTATGSYTVGQQDNVAPTARTRNITLALDANGTTMLAPADVDAGSSDNCAFTLSLDRTAFSCAERGPQMVTLTATDAAGHTSSAPATVTIIDNTNPTITAPAAKAVSTNAGQCSATGVALGTAAAGDNCSGVVVTNNAPATFPKGVTTVTWKATDAAGNVATATQTVTVTDNELPTITAPAAKAASTNAGQCSATNVALGTAAAGDNCPGVVVTNNAPATFPKGVTTVTWTATDAAGNVATAMQVVTVTDNELPTITAPAAKAASTNAGQCSATGVALGTAAAGDNCPGVVVSNNAPATFPKGVTTVTWKATDAAGNVATATQTVTVTDNERPVLGTLLNLVLSAPAAQCGAVVSFNPTATDNCAGATVVSSPASGSTFVVGTSTVTVTATDASGNQSTSSFTVTVNDVTAPAVVTRNVSVTLVNGTATVTTAQVDNGSTDACGIVGYRLSRTVFSCANIGPNPVVLTVTDVHGNAASAPAVVTVVGTIPAPVVTVVPASSVYTGGVPTTLYLGYGPQSATLSTPGFVSYAWSPAAGLSSPSSGAPVFTATAVGTYTYTVSVVNQYGCTATTSVTLRVVDVRCGNNNDKVIVCHNGHEICISSNAVPAHLTGHPGDQLGTCGTAARSASTATPLAKLLLETAPNPFSANTTVHFRPVVTAAAQVHVYDALGRVVATLFDDIAEAGHDYTLTLSGEHLANGIYLCRYESQGKVQTQRLSLVK